MSTELTAKKIKDGMTPGIWANYTFPYHEVISNNKIGSAPVLSLDVHPACMEQEKIANGEGIARMYNSTYGKGLDPEKMEECVNKLQSAFYFLQELEEHGVINKTLMEEIDEVLESARIK